MKKGRKILWAVVIALFLTIYSENIKAQEIKLLTRETAVVFKNIDGSDSKAFEPSAVEPIGNGKFLLVADDKDVKGKSLKIVEAATGRVLKTLDRIQPVDKNPKWEAMAKDEQGNYYVIGSHNHVDDEQKLALRSLMFSFRLENEMEPDGMNIAIDTKTIKPLNVKDSLTSLGLYNHIPANNTVKIEGLAVRTNGTQKELIFGFREPSNIVQVYLATIPGDELKNPALFKFSLERFFQFDAGTTSDNTFYKLSSIEYVQDLKGFLVLTSTETAGIDGKPVFHGNALWFVSNKASKDAQAKLLTAGDKSTMAQKIFEFEPAMKVEGICLLNSRKNKTYRIGLVYDNDAEDSGLSGKMQFIELAAKN